MLKKPKHFPFYCFLLPLFFVLHVVSGYFGLISAQFIFQFLGYYILLSAFLLLVGYFMFKSIVKAGVWAMFFLLVFYFFGAIHDFLKVYVSPGFLKSYSLLLPLFTISFLLYTIYIKRTGKSLRVIHKYFTILFVLLVGIETGLLIIKTLSNQQKHNDYALNNRSEIVGFKIHDSIQKPDIFFIIFDEYASSASLKKYFGFDNAFTDSFFISNNFYIAPNAKSNYNSTPLSIAASLNLQYFNKHLEQDSTTTKSMLQGWYSLKKSRLPDLLADNGYRVVNLGLCDFENFPVHTSETFLEYEIKTLYQETIWGRIQRDIWWNIYKLKLPFVENTVLKNHQRYKEQYTGRNLTNLKSTL